MVGRLSGSPRSRGRASRALSALGSRGSPFPGLRLMATSCHVVMESGRFTEKVWWETLLLEEAGRGIAESLSRGDHHYGGVSGSPQERHPHERVLIWGEPLGSAFPSRAVATMDYAENSMAPLGALAMMDVH